MGPSVEPNDRLGAFVVGPALLAPGQPGGPLTGMHFAVKDVFDISGMRTGAGNPDWLAGAPVASAHAVAVDALLAAGAELWGKTVTDELAFSLLGTNVHYGTPVNPAAPGRVPGGSSSGSASAVAGGVVPLTLASDTGGSTRVPASYCGIYGIRPTHGRIDTTGMVPLAPSFDTVGLLARDGATMARGWDALVDGAGVSAPSPKRRRPGRLVVATDLFDLADEEVRPAMLEAAVALARRLGVEVTERRLATDATLERWRDGFGAIELVEAWRSDGTWISARRPALGPGVASRFAAAATMDPAIAERANARRGQALDALQAASGDDGILIQPAASGPAPPVNVSGTVKDDLRARTMLLTAPAGMAGAPAVSLPMVRLSGLPVGLAAVGLPGDDEVLADIAVRSAGSR